MTALYNLIGTQYNSSRAADPGIVSRLSKFLAISNSQRYIDIACGSGNYTAALANVGGQWTGIDISEVMLTRAKARAAGMEWRLGDASELPFESDVFSGAVCTLAAHHFQSLDQPFQEARRALKSGALVLFTGLADQMRNYWLYHYFPEMMRQSIDAMPTEERLRESLYHAGFKEVKTFPFFITSSLQDLFLFSGKVRPEIYFDKSVRNNMSSFSRLCEQNELTTGLAALERDINSGTFEAVQLRHESTRGDYAFIVASTGI